MQCASRHMTQRYQKLWPEGTHRDMQRPSEHLWMISAVFVGDMNIGCYRHKGIPAQHCCRG
eukprot:7758632-Karenia_brevis.AAC.1